METYHFTKKQISDIVRSADLHKKGWKHLLVDATPEEIGYEEEKDSDSDDE
jgi:hypothetical protein